MVFWMENCVVNMSGKRERFVVLDIFNEYIVREVKEMIANVVTTEKEKHLQEVISILVVIIWDIRIKKARQLKQICSICSRFLNRRS